MENAQYNDATPHAGPVIGLGMRGCEEAASLHTLIWRLYKMPETTTLFSVQDSDFQQVVLDSEKPVVVDFWAPWCGPCRMVSPIVEELSHEYGDEMLFVKMNTDENEETMINYGVTSIPTLIVFSGGREMNRIVGFAPKDQLKRQIDRSLAQ